MRLFDYKKIISTLSFVNLHTENFEVGKEYAIKYSAINKLFGSCNFGTTTEGYSDQPKERSIRLFLIKLNFFFFFKKFSFLLIFSFFYMGSIIVYFTLQVDLSLPESKKECAMMEEMYLLKKGDKSQKGPFWVGPLIDCGLLKQRSQEIYVQIYKKAKYFYANTSYLNLFSLDDFIFFSKKNLNLINIRNRLIKKNKVFFKCIFDDLYFKTNCNLEEARKIICPQKSF